MSISVWDLTPDFAFQEPWSGVLIFPASNELTQPMSLKRQVATKKKTPTITTAETITTGTATTTAQPRPRPYLTPTVQPND
jgi:hypothetical protein